MKKEKILLLNPNFVTEISKKIQKNSYSLKEYFMNIVSILVKNNYDVHLRIEMVRINDFNDDIKYIKNENFNFIYIILGVNIHLFNSSLIYAKEIKNICPNTKIVLFHRASNYLAENALNSGYIDIVVRSEEDLPSLYIARNEHLKNINGISYKDSNNVIIHNPRCEVDNVNNLSGSLYGYELLSKNLPYDVDYYTWYSKGCSNDRFYSMRCDICPDHELCEVRYRNHESLIDEIKYLYNHYDIGNKLSFSDPVFTRDKHKVYELMDEFDKKGLNIKWSMFTHPNLVDYDLLKCLKDHGCDYIVYHFMNDLDKVTVDDIYKCIENTNKLEINCENGFYFGLPDDKMDDIMDIINIYKKNNMVIHMRLLKTMEGSPFYERNYNNLLRTDYDYYTTENQIVKMNYIPLNKMEKIQKVTNYEYINKTNTFEGRVI
jgi:hypothetical protein